jgi:3-deoxy-7-phosphoheptulonate synthase
VGKRNFVPAMALASVAAGADGLLMEMHPNPDKAMSDGAQSLFPNQLEHLVEQLRKLAPIVGRTVA